MRKLSLLSGISALAVGLSAAPAMAQDNADAPKKTGIGEIVVTAQKYEQNLQETPISIVAVGGEELEAMGVDNINDFGTFLPNVSIGGTMGQGDAIAAFSIRGIGGNPSGFITTESAVGVYIDDVLFARPNGALLDLLDVERVEVLRGPQGTLFGRNTAGGAIRYVTKMPEFNGVSGFVKAAFGEYDRMDVAGAINLPLGETVAARAVFSSKSRDGHITRLIDGDKAGDQDSKAMRLQLRWQPTDRLDINISGDKIITKNDGSATIAGDFSMTDLYPDRLYCVAAGGSAPGNPPCNPTTAAQAQALVSPEVSVSGYTDRDADIAYYQDQITNRYQVFGSPQKDLNRLESYGFSGTIAYDLTDDITIKSLTGYRKLEQIQDQDFDRTPLPIYYLTEDIDIEYFTQELQITGLSFDDRLQWVLGAFYYHDDAKDWRRRSGTSDPSNSSFANDLSAIDPDGAGQGIGVLERKLLKTESLAFYGQGTFALTDQMNFTAGLRWTRDEKDYTGFREPRGTVCIQPDGSYIGARDPACVGTVTSVTHSASGSWTNVSPRFTLDYQWTPDIMTYVSASRGFKGGGFNDTVDSRCSTGETELCGLTEFAPETLWNYEAGLRTDLFNGMVRFNLTGFYVKYSDLQIEYIETRFGPPTRYVVNGNMTVKGFESELMVAPTDGLLLRANVGYTDSQYDDDVVRDGEVVIEKSVPFFRSPKWSYTLGANYTMPAGDDGEVNLDVNWGWKDSQASTAIPTNMIILPSYGLLNGRIEYRNDGGWSIAAVATNLLDKYYVPNGFDPGGPSTQESPFSNLAHDAVFGFSMYDVGRPRELGIELKYQF